MTAIHTAGKNCSSVSIWEARLQRCATDTNEHENTQTPTLSIEALRNIGHIVRFIQARINEANGHDHDSSATYTPIDSGSRAAIGAMGSEDPDGAKKEKR